MTSEMARDEGYTLTEMLLALLMASLALLGVAFTVRTLAQAETRVAGLRQQQIGPVRDRLVRALAEAGPFIVPASGSDTDLQGTSRGLSLGCGRSARCSFEVTGAAGGESALKISPEGRSLRLPRLRAPQFGYVSALDGRTSQAWPPPDRADRLGAVVFGDGDTPLVVARVGRDQPAACAFDGRTGGCLSTVSAP